MELKLSKRLLTVAALVPSCDTLADIGSDHGLLPLYLLQKQRIKKAYCCDIRTGPLKAAEKNIALYGLADVATPLLGSGLFPVQNRPHEVAVIAGMGGETIAQILGDDEIADDDPRLFVLQPMSRANLLREYLAENEFEVLDFVLCKDGGHLYECFSVRKGKKVETDPLYRYVGRQHHADDALYKEYLTEYRRRLLTILAGHAASSAVETEETAKQRALAAALDQLLR
ncbi:MAG: SAM-dependent methyltransferase [Clostridia bacterium]|nr:SAM-dependent methyltransferase [Clostridia bacterium]